MIPKIFHQSSKYFTWEERRLARRAQALMPEWTYHAWTDEDNLALVEKIFPSNVERLREISSLVVAKSILQDISICISMGVFILIQTSVFFEPIDENLLSHSCILGVEDED